MNDQASGGDSRESRVINASSRVSLSAAAAVFASVLGVGWALSARLATIDVRLQSLESRHDGSAELALRLATIESITADHERRVNAFERTGSEALRTMSHSLDDRIRVTESFVRESTARHFSGADMDLWIEQARSRPSLDKLPDRPRQ